jgi:hypothetical protein
MVCLSDMAQGRLVIKGIRKGSSLGALAKQPRFCASSPGLLRRYVSRN